ncbi:hypothetical protein H8959_018412, partial [Pygathrix nigripes]
ETLQQRLEDLEQEKINLHFQLPSRQPALSSFLGHLAAQVQAALRHGATQQASGDDTHASLRTEPRLLERTAQDSLHRQSCKSGLSKAGTSGMISRLRGSPKLAQNRGCKLAKNHREATNLGAAAS